MKLDKERISKIKSNIEVDLEFLQEARQECKSFEPFDYDDNADAFFNTIEEKLKYAIECLDDCNKTSDLNKKTVYIDAVIISIESIKYVIYGLLDGIVDKMNDRFERIERDLNQRLSKQFGVNEWNRDDRPNGVRIGANLNLILVMI